jgi:glycosyltransferase involved in cell wall biosynthesis
VWDQDLLNALYAGSASYLHGHSVGGTNPSLLRAMGAGASVVAWDVNFNREVLGDAGRFFAGPVELAQLIESMEASPEAARARGTSARERAASTYRWDEVAKGYEQLCQELLARTRTRRVRRVRTQGRGA